jgi:ABC-type nickel/cobalt efflux system permease component RcnA
MAQSVAQSIPLGASTSQCTSDGCPPVQNSGLTKRGAAVGIVMGAVALSLIILTPCWMFIKGRRKRREQAVESRDSQHLSMEDHLLDNWSISSRTSLHLSDIQAPITNKPSHSPNPPNQVRPPPFERFNHLKAQTVAFHEGNPSFGHPAPPSLPTTSPSTIHPPKSTHINKHTRRKNRHRNQERRQPQSLIAQRAAAGYDSAYRGN